MNIKRIKKKYDCPDKPYTEHPNHINTSLVTGQEIWSGKGKIECILTTRGEMRARAFWAGFYSSECPELCMRKYFNAPLQFKGHGEDLRSIL